MIKLPALLSLAAALLALSPAALASSLSWKGYIWSFKSGSDSAPGPNDWNPNNAFVDTNGYLHLTITSNSVSGHWDCAGLYTTSNLRFGTYQWEVECRLDELDPNAVLGLFPYGGPPDLNEIDIEYTRWTYQKTNCWWTVYPNSGTNVTKNSVLFALNGPYTTSRLTWSCSGVHYWHMSDFEPMGSTTNLFAEWNDTPANPSQNIPQQAMSTHMNLWLNETRAPSQSVEVIIHDFTTTGTPNASLSWLGDGSNNFWDTTNSIDWQKAEVTDYFYAGDTATFADSSTNFSVNISGNVLPAGTTVNTTNTYNLGSTSGGSIASGSFLKQGAGQLVLTTANTFSGPTVLSAGTTWAGNSSALGSGTITLGDTNSGSSPITLLVDNGAALNNAVTVTTNGTGMVTVGYGASGNCKFSGPISLQRGITFYNSNATVNSLFVQGGISGTGVVIVAGGGFHKWQTVNCQFTGYIYVTNAGTLLDVNTGLGTNNVDVAAGAMFGNVSAPYLNALSGAGLVAPGPGAASTPALRIGYANGSGTFSGSFTTNSGGYSCNCNKGGTGTEVLTGDNSASAGSTTINAGTLAVNNATGYGLGLGGVTVNAGGTLAGNGTIYAAGNNTFVINGTLSVGNAGEAAGATFTLTNKNGLSINSGAAMSVGLLSGAGAGDNTHNPAAADLLNAQCSVSLNSGSILTIANPKGLTAWAGGDKWKIVNWLSSPTGTFTTLNLPALGGSLVWDTSQLYTSGVIAVVATAPTRSAQILGVTGSGTNLVINGTNNNIPNTSFHYAVLSSTNAALPMTIWTVLSTNPFSANGTFNYTSAIAPAKPAMFFEIKAVP